MKNSSSMLEPKMLRFSEHDISNLGARTTRMVARPYIDSNVSRQRVTLDDQLMDNDNVISGLFVPRSI